ncbi:hypothetical protein OH492_08670 [Vibrio chagasii]|nr:hypothetical protein [Vibrio chagasii]
MKTQYPRCAFLVKISAGGYVPALKEANVALLAEHALKIRIGEIPTTAATCLGKGRSGGQRYFT